MPDKHVNLTGASNFRDLGGYETEDGMKLKQGLIYRSDNLSHLSEEDLKKINQIGIKTVCDFRSDIELDEFPSPFSKKTLPVLKHIPIKTLGTKDLRELSTRDDVTSEEMAKEMQHHYVLYVHQHKKKYRDFINLVAFGEIPLVFHCFAGKDRTGFGALLYLGLLGVRKETIIEDYLLTNKYFKGPIMKEDWRDTSSEKLKPLFEARVDYINAAFSEIYLSYNSIEDFVVKELEINNQTVDLLKTRILE
jgi:protein-tyrosine phosphatase